MRTTAAAAMGARERIAAWRCQHIAHLERELVRQLMVLVQHNARQVPRLQLLQVRAKRRRARVRLAQVQQRQARVKQAVDSGRLARQDGWGSEEHQLHSRALQLLPPLPPSRCCRAAAAAAASRAAAAVRRLLSAAP